MAFATQFTSLNYSGYGDLDMFSDSAPYAPKAQFNALVAEVEKYGGPSITVTKGGATVTPSLNPINVAEGASDTYSATVTGNDGIPTGSVTFAIGATSLCSATLSGGFGSCTSSIAPIGATQKVTATYSGSSTYDQSNGNASLSVAPPEPLPPPGSTGSAAAAGGPTGTTTATVGGITASASGYGSFTVASYGSNPTMASVTDGTGTYYDVGVSPGSALSSLTIVVCGEGSADSLDWFNGSAWVAFSQQGTRSGCLFATVTNSTSPTLAQLGGTPIALLDVPAGPPQLPPTSTTTVLEPRLLVGGLRRWNLLLRVLPLLRLNGEPAPRAAGRRHHAHGR